MAKREERTDLAKLIVGFGGGAILAAVIAASVVMLVDPEAQNATVIFNSLIPLVGAWVGAIISFYFGKDNYQMAAEHSKEIISQLRATNEKLSTIPVERAMIAFDKLTVGHESDLAKDALAEMVAKSVDRLPVLKDNSRVPVAFLERTDLQPFEHDNAMTLFRIIDVKRTAYSAFKLLPINATLRDASELLNRPSQPKVSAVFITQNGAKDEPLMGMIVAKDISKFA